MLLSFSQRKLTPMKINRTPLKQKPKPQCFTFSTNRLKKLPLVQLTNTPFVAKAEKPHIEYSSKNSSQRSFISNKIYRVVLTPEKKLQFGRKDSDVKKVAQNIFSGESIKRVPLTFMDMNCRRTVKPSETPQRYRLKTRSISQQPIAFNNKFSRKQSKNCPQESRELKRKSTATMQQFHSALTIFESKSKNQLEKANIKIQDFSKGKLLGKGYFGQVYIVRHKSTGFICALKILSKQKIRAEKVEQSLLRQIKIHSFVNHQNIISLYTVFEDSTNIYILQQIAADNLYNVLTKHKHLKQPQSVPYISQTLEGLQYLHQHKIMHRDIKPQNILISYDGKIKICDFGWAVYEPNGMRKSNIGTLLYLSPENIIGKGYDFRHDIWAVGIMSYELLTGSIPFNIWLTDDINFPEYIEVSKIAKVFVFRMLQKEPSKRASISALLQDSFLKQVSF